MPAETRTGDEMIAQGLLACDLVRAGGKVVRGEELTEHHRGLLVDVKNLFGAYLGESDGLYDGRIAIKDTLPVIESRAQQAGETAERYIQRLRDTVSDFLATGAVNVSDLTELRRLALGISDMQAGKAQEAGSRTFDPEFPSVIG